MKKTVSMWKLYIVLSLFIGVATGAKAQECGVDSVPGTPLADFPTVIYPPSDSLPCAVLGQAVSDTLYFTNFTTIQGFTVVSITIDSINNLPYGLCWATNVTGNTFPAGQNGVIFLTGTPGGTTGQFKLSIHLSATTDIAQIPDFDLEKATGYRYYVRLASPGCVCNAIDSAGGVDSSIITYSCPAGINAISNGLSDLSVIPNPFSEMATVSFSSDVAGRFNMQLVNMLGQALVNENVNVVNGSNEFTIKGNGLSSGIYILNISDGSNSQMKKVVVE